MAALDEILDLEQRIDNLRKDLIQKGREKVRCEDTIKRSSAALGAAQAKITHHRGNRQHMRQVADHVDIKEWAKTQQHLASALGQHEDATIALAAAQSVMKRVLAAIDANEVEISSLQKRLSQFGQVEEFPARERPEA